MLLLKFIPAIMGCHKRSLFSGLGLVLFVCLFVCWMVGFPFRVLKTGLKEHY